VILNVKMMENVRPIRIRIMFACVQKDLSEKLVVYIFLFITKKKIENFLTIFFFRDQRSL